MVAFERFVDYDFASVSKLIREFQEDVESVRGCIDNGTIVNGTHDRYSTASVNAYCLCLASGFRSDLNLGYQTVLPVLLHSLRKCHF